jgi:uncharacterized membrane protein (UPF0127 family)
MARSGAAVPRVARNETRASVLADHVAIAGSLWAKFWGLIGRRSLAAGEGLWLPHENGIHMFFMRFPIDAVFVARPAVDGSRLIVAVCAGLRPWTGIVWYARGADACLELPAGAAAASGTIVGDVIAMVRESAAG